MRVDTLLETCPEHSPSIVLYRHQAEYFDGQPDGKIEVALRETKRFQAIMSAGNN